MARRRSRHIEFVKGFLVCVRPGSDQGTHDDTALPPDAHSFVGFALLAEGADPFPFSILET